MNQTQSETASKMSVLTRNRRPDLRCDNDDRDKVQQKTVEMPPLQLIQRQVPMLHTAQKTGQVPQVLTE